MSLRNFVQKCAVFVDLELAISRQSAQENLFSFLVYTESKITQSLVMTGGVIFTDLNITRPKQSLKFTSCDFSPAYNNPAGSRYVFSQGRI